MEHDYNNIKWWLTIVYASPQNNSRAQNWIDLANINPGPDASWALMGDFNDTIDPSEKFGGVPWDPHRGKLFSQ